MHSTISLFDQRPNKQARCSEPGYTIEFVSRRFYNIISFGGRAQPALVSELGR
jgi:hypothetical protein